MNKQEIIYGIITAHDKPTINQDDLTDAYIEFTGDNITNREVRQVIADCIEEETYLIISTPQKPGGYSCRLINMKVMPALIGWKARG